LPARDYNLKSLFQKLFHVRLVNIGVRDQHIKIRRGTHEGEALPAELGVIGQANTLPGSLDQQLLDFGLGMVSRGHPVGGIDAGDPQDSLVKIRINRGYHWSDSIRFGVTREGTAQ